MGGVVLFIAERRFEVMVCLLSPIVRGNRWIVRRDFG